MKGETKKERETRKVKEKKSQGSWTRQAQSAVVRVVASAVLLPRPKKKAPGTACAKAALS